MEKYRKWWLRQHANYERKAFAIFRNAIIKSIQNIPFDKMELWNYQILISMNINTEEISKAYYQVYFTIGRDHGQKVGAMINKEVKLFQWEQFKEIFDRNLVTWLQSNLGQSITTVRGTLIEYIVGLIQTRLEEGKTISEISTELRDMVNRRDFYRWQAMRIARTESTSAANYGASVAGSVSGIALDKEWITVLDNRTRVIPEDQFDHRVMNGVKVAQNGLFDVQGDLIAFPGDPKSRAGNRINCYLPGTIINGNIKGAQKSFYSGEVVEIVSVGGKRITITPNHGIATDNGFIPANKINVGDNLITDIREKNWLFGLINDYIQQKFTAENIFSSFDKLFRSERFMVGALDFDGDGEAMDGNVYVVNAELPLRNSIKTFINKIFNYFNFKTSNPVVVNKCGFSSFNLFRSRNGSTFRRLMSFLILSFPLCFRHICPFNFFSIGFSSNINSIRFKDSINDRSRDPIFLRELINADSNFISFDKVSSVRKFYFSGHVYDFTSVNGVNIANNIYTSNCRCSVALVPKRDALGRLMLNF